MFQKWDAMAIIQNSWSNCKSLCIQKKNGTCMYPPYTRILFIPPIHEFYLSPISLPLSVDFENSIFLFRLLCGVPKCWTIGRDLISTECTQAKICKLVYKPIKIRCTFVQIWSPYNIFSYYLSVSDGGLGCNCMYHQCLTSNDLDSVLLNHHSLTIKMHKIIYMSMSANQWVHEKINKTILNGGTVNFARKVRHTCTSGTRGGDRWVSDDPNWVLLKLQSLTISYIK